MTRRKGEGPARQADSLRPALLPGGAVVFDASGEVRFGLSEESLRRLVGDAPDFLRLAVAHLAAEQAAEAGLAAPWDEALEGDEGEDRSARGARARPTRSLGSDVPLRVVRSRGFLAAYLMSACLQARRSGEAAIPVVESGRRRYVGPALSPEKGPCIICMRRAISPNRRSESFLVAEADRGPGPGLSEDEAVRLVREESHSPCEEILEVGGDGRVVARHHVRADPECRICGGPRIDANAAFPSLETRRPVGSQDTGSRVRHPRETFEAYRHLISPVSGAVRRIRRVDMGETDLIHVYTASHAMTEQARSFAAVMRDGRDHSGGKGSSREQARVSALCEALERFSAVARGGEVDVVGPADGVEGAIHPAETLLFSEAQYAGRAAWNRAVSRFHFVPEPFDETADVAWSRVWCLNDRQPAYLPTALLHYDFDGAGSEFCRADSNGLAAGGNLEEAALQALLEVIERDAVAIWWYNRLRMPEVDVASFADDYVRDVLAHYARLGRRSWVLDLTSDLGVPVFAAVSVREQEARPEPIFGFGAHMDPGVALRRCVTEMSQMLATAIRPPEERETRLRGAFDDVLSWWDEATLDEEPYLLPDPGLQRRGRACFGYASSDDLLADLEACVAIAGDRGLRVYVRDMTRPDLGIAVAKIVVPGLRHFWRRLAPGRLYDVPVTTGRRAAPASEADLNPISLFV